MIPLNCTMEICVYLKMLVTAVVLWMPLEKKTKNLLVGKEKNHSCVGRSDGQQIPADGLHHIRVLNFYFKELLESRRSKFWNIKENIKGMKTPAISEKKEPTHKDKDTNKRDAQTFYTNYKIVKKNLLLICSLKKKTWVLLLRRTFSIVKSTVSWQIFHWHVSPPRQRCSSYLRYNQLQKSHQAAPLLRQFL